MPTEERETIVQMDDASQEANLWTNQPVMIRRLERLGLTGQVLGAGVQFQFPTKWLKFHKPRVISPSMRARLAEQGRNLAKARHKPKQEP